MQIIDNPWRGQGIDLAETPFPSTDVDAVRTLLALCPIAAITPLRDAPELARRVGVARVSIKDERGRMRLGSFKALGAAYVIAQEAAASNKEDMGEALRGRCFVTASAGNHGLSVAAAAAVFGARAVVYLAETVPEAFAVRLAGKKADVVRAGASYEDSMRAAERAAEDNGWTLLSDSSWPGYMHLPHRLMEGYLAMADEIGDQMQDAPTHILLQAGVGGLAGACAAMFRSIWGDAPQIVVVEPEVAPALHASIRDGAICETRGPVSIMGRLDCKTPSMIALRGLSRDADKFVLISDSDAMAALPILAKEGLESTPSGAAGLAAMLAADAREALGLTPESRVLCILSEEPDT